MLKTNRYLHFVSVAVTAIFLTLAPAVTAAVGDTTDHGWIATLKYTPSNGLHYELNSMRTGKTIRVFFGTKPQTSQVIAGGRKYRIHLKKYTMKKQGNTEVFTSQFKDIFKVKTTFTRKNIWQFTVRRKLTALQDLKLHWYENYLNSNLLINRKVTAGNGKAAVISEKPLPVKQMFKVLSGSPRVKELAFDSTIGKINLKFAAPIVLIDHRGAPWRRQDNAHLLYQDVKLKKGESIELAMQINITPNFEGLKKYQPQAVLPDIYSSANQLPESQVIMPAPKSVVRGKGFFLLKTSATLFYKKSGHLNIVKPLQKFFRAMFKMQVAAKSLPEKFGHTLILSNGMLPLDSSMIVATMQKKAATLKPQGSYCLRVTGKAVFIVSKSERGVWNGVMTLLQLSRHQMATNGIKYGQLQITDYPDFAYRGIYVRIQSELDYKWSRQFVAVMAELKYNQVYLHFSSGIGVRFKADPNCYDHTKTSISPSQFTEFIRYIKNFNMEVIPIWAAGKTMLSEQHFKKCPKLAALTINRNKNWDISLDKVFEYHKAILDEIIKLTGAKTIHLGLDEIMHFAKYCRNNTGHGDVILSNYINKFTDYYAPRGIKVIVYHDMLLNRKKVKAPAGGYFAANASAGSENALKLFRNRNMLVIEDWSYSENKTYADFDDLAKSGLKVYPSCWYRYKNILGLAAYTKDRSDTFVCTYWSKPRENNRNRLWDPRGRRNLTDRFRTYKFLPAMGLAAEAAWNGGKTNLPYNFLAETLRLFNQRQGLNIPGKACRMVDLSKLANRKLTDTVKNDGKGFIDLGREFSIPNFPVGKQQFGGIPFMIASDGKQPLAVAVKNKYTENLPSAVTIPLSPGRYRELELLHTCHFDFEQNVSKKLNVGYTVHYQDGSKRDISLVNDDNIMAWAPALTRYDADNNRLWLAWVGITPGDLPVAIYGYSWRNPFPKKIITSVTIQSRPKSGDALFLIGLTAVK